MARIGLCIAAILCMAAYAAAETPLASTANDTATDNSTSADVLAAATVAYCPSSWPAAPAGSVLVYLAVRFANTGGAACGSPSFPGSAKRVSSFTAKALGNLVKLHDKAHSDDIGKWAAFAAVKAGSTCEAQDDGHSLATTFVAIKVRKAAFYLSTAKHWTAGALHLADLCPAGAASYPDPDLAYAYNDLCFALGGGTRAEYVRACVQDAPGSNWVVGRTGGLPV